MTTYAVVITLLLVCPWAVVGVMAVGAALARLRSGWRTGRLRPRGDWGRGPATVAGIVRPGPARAAAR
jgi:hypothetical protein